MAELVKSFGGALSSEHGDGRTRGWLNEVISTLLLNYIAVLFVGYFIFGPWRDPSSANFPQTVAFASNVRTSRRATCEPKQ